MPPRIIAAAVSGRYPFSPKGVNILVNVIYKKYGLKINAIWFCEDISIYQCPSKASILFFHGANKPSSGYDISFVQNTLLSDLEEPAESILMRINSKVRNQIHKAFREDIGVEVFQGDDFIKDRAIITSFKKDYIEFTKIKKIKNTYNEAAVEQYIKNGNLLLTKAFHGGQVLAQHTFVVDGSTARGLYSVSKFRSAGVDPNVIGRANKYLHWRDIQYLQEQHYKTLDWGGIKSASEPTGVDEFKLRFGGTEHSYYNVLVGNTPIGKIALSLLKLSKRFG